MNDFVLEILVRDRLAELQATAERAAWRRARRAASPPWRVVLRGVLVRFVNALLGVKGRRPGVRAPSTTGA